MTDHVADRDVVLGNLRSELFGPWSPWDGEDRSDILGEAIDFSSDVRFETKEASYPPHVQLDSGDEVLKRDRPCKRYGVGVLFPLRDRADSDGGDAGEEPVVLDNDNDSSLVASSAESDLAQIADRSLGGQSDDADFDLNGANEFRPSAMAVSFLVDLPPEAKLVVEVEGGRYVRRQVTVAGAQRNWWLRRGVSQRYELDGSELTVGNSRLISALAVDAEPVAHDDGFALDVSAFTRPEAGGRSLLTVSLVNRSALPPRGGPDEACLFQTRFRVFTVVGEQRVNAIRPYPERPTSSTSDVETESFDLLYRKMKTFGVGHGCAADWDGPQEVSVVEIRAEAMPVVETPSVTPRIFTAFEDGTKEEVTVPMGPLAGLDPSHDGFAALQAVIDHYESWWRLQEKRVAGLDERYQPAALRHLEECERVLERMRKGLEFVSSGKARRAFQLANEAVLLQQLRTRRTARPTILEGDRLRVDEPLQVPDWRSAKDRGSWRPFQIAFLLCAVESSVNPDSHERDTVELIWFPTGGGKTEAYLGLAAFALVYRRLLDPKDAGVEVLMRYTLRLLTQQQFQRAAGLVLALETIRKREGDLGGEFSIGIWLGGSSTPNSRRDAKQTLSKLSKGDETAAKFVILRCPWCSASMGLIEKANIKGKPAKNAPKVAGYVDDNGSVRFRCPDAKCAFHKGMPIYVVDEDIYDVRPSIVIGTVDKFALLAWNPRCRELFGIGPDGTRFASPPQTIIQDELHLIAGPLGSMVGIFESVIEHLCTDFRGDAVRRPKIVSSTATIRRYHDQIRALYAREDVVLFPPRGLDASDSFFARFATEDDGTLSPGRMYVGIHAPGLGSMQTAQVRTFSALLQAPQPFSDEDRDPWWTLMVFFNSLRELGTSLSLLQSDVPNYLEVMRQRLGLDYPAMRTLRSVKELTGRLKNEEVPKAIDQLSQPASGDAVDVCLASNVIEVGIDIDRLSVMAVVGQPKTTSQYIQVTGRVGRQWFSRPGLVATIFSPTKPRDRSHFEKFRSYHERLYAQVEPTSVTPFSPPVLDRALHAVLIAFVRQAGLANLSPQDIPVELIERAYEVLNARVEAVDPEEQESLERVFDKLRHEWQTRNPPEWQRNRSSQNAALMYRAGEYASPLVKQLSWSTPTSMRNVDAECRAEVSSSYVRAATNPSDPETEGGTDV